MSFLSNYKVYDKWELHDNRQSKNSAAQQQEQAHAPPHRYIARAAFVCVSERAHKRVSPLNFYSHLRWCACALFALFESGQVSVHWCACEKYLCELEKVANEAARRQHERQQRQ